MVYEGFRFDYISHYVDRLAVVQEKVISKHRKATEQHANNKTKFLQNIIGPQAFQSF